MIGIEHFETSKICRYCAEIHALCFILSLFDQVMEILVGLGIIYPDTRELTGRLTILFLLAIYPANFNMWINDVPFNGTRLTTQGHLVRLSVQILLIIAAQVLR